MQYTVCCLMTLQILEASPTKFPLVEYEMRLLEQLMHDQRYILRRDVTVIVHQIVPHHFHYCFAYPLVTSHFLSLKNKKERHMVIFTVS